jgi:hypothetical protein
MIIRCQTCSSDLEKVNDATNFAFGWYRDDSGNHTGFICNKCGAIHDCVASLNFISPFFGGPTFKVVRHFPLPHIKNLMRQEATRNGSGFNSEATLLEMLFGVPQNIVFKMMELGFIDAWENF